jgi:MFS transporter, FHS family, L-fucose permease
MDSRRAAVGLMYWIFAGFTLLMVAILSFSRFPRVQYTAEERAGSWEMYLSLARKRVVWMYFVAMFAYVGCEQGTADWISKFLYQYHGFDPHTKGATAVSWFWGLLTGGCSIGMLLLKIFDSRKVLIGACIGALFCLSASFAGSGECVSARFSRDRLVRVGDVAHRHFART